MKACLPSNQCTVPENTKLLQIQHITNLPHFPQSNGFAKAVVKIAKKLMDCSRLQGKQWNLGLMEYRSTPITAKIPSPLEILKDENQEQTYHLFHKVIHQIENIMKLLSRNNRWTFQTNSPFLHMSQVKWYDASIP